MARLKMFRCAVAAALVAVLAQDASAQTDYPNRPIRLVSPSPPAGVHDVIGRLWAERRAVRGAAFYIALPLAKEATSPAPPPSES